jgi:periplasmic protein CpxP/Spy
MSTTTTSRNKNLIFIIAALLLTNIAVLVYFIWIKDTPEKKDNANGPSRNGMTDILQKEVKFDTIQLAQYKVLRDSQKAAMHPMFDQMRKAKDSLFHMISNGNSTDSDISGAADVIAEKQRAIDLRTFYHFKKIRAICTPDQLANYDSAVFRMFSRMGKPPKKDADKSKDNK